MGENETKKIDEAAKILSSPGGSYPSGNFIPAAAKFAEAFPGGEFAVNLIRRAGEGPNEAAGSAGDAAALLVPKAVSKIALRVPAVKSLLNPSDQAAVDFVQNKPALNTTPPRGPNATTVDLDAGTATGNPFVKSTQGILEHQPLSAGIARRAKDATAQQFVDLGNELKDRIAPGPVDGEGTVAGNELTRRLESRITGANAVADKQYQRARDISNQPQNVASVQTGTVPPAVQLPPSAGKPLQGTVPIMQDMALPVDTTAMKRELAPLVARIEAQVPAAQRAASPGYQALRQIMDRPNMVPLDTANADLSAIQKIGRGADLPELSSVSQGIAKTIVPKYRQAIDTAAAQDPRVLAAMNQGRAATKTKYQTADLLKRFPDEPVKLANKLLGSYDTNANLLESVARVAPQQVEKLGKTLVQGILDTATENGTMGKGLQAASQWNKIGPRTKAALIPDPVVRSGLDKYFRAVQMWSENMNPSGSGKMASLTATGHLLLHNPATGVATVIGSRYLAKALFGPGGADRILQGLSVPIGSKFAVPLYMDILANAGMQPERAPQQRVPFVGPVQ
jgi:hypothetical protein